MNRSARPSLVLTVAGLVVLAAACGGSQPPAPAPGGPAAPAPAGKAAPATAPASGGSALPAPSAEPDRVVATVNGVPIQNSKVEEVLQANKMQAQSRGRALSADDEKVLRAASAKALIDEELLFQAAEKANLRPTPKDIDDEIQHVKSQLGSEENFKKFLQQIGQTEEQVRKDAARRLEVQKYVRTVVKGAAVPEAEVRKYFDTNKAQFQATETVHAQVIVVKAAASDPDGKKADARKRIEEAHRRAVAGEDFGALAKAYSQIENAKQGGDMGFFPRGVMFPKFEEVAFGTPPGKVSDVFETPAGFNVLKILEKRPARPLEFDEVKSMLSMDMTKTLESRLLENRITELANKADIKILDAALQAAPAAPKPGEKTAAR